MHIGHRLACELLHKLQQGPAFVEILVKIVTGRVSTEEAWLIGVLRKRRLAVGWCEQVMRAVLAGFRSYLDNIFKRLHSRLQEHHIEPIGKSALLNIDPSYKQGHEI